MEQDRSTQDRSEPRQDKDNTKGTEKPWERPGQKSQNPDEEPASPHDLETWQKSNTH